jgi:hypothetical protein
MPTARLDWRRVAAAACLKVDWKQLAVAALGSATLAELVVDSLHRLGRRLEDDAARSSATARTDCVSEPAPSLGGNDAPASVESAAAAEKQPVEGTTTHLFVDIAAIRAAVLLGVDVYANEDVIRAALRERLSSSRIHPDHGGDGEEATRLIAAKNLLIERAKGMRR